MASTLSTAKKHLSKDPILAPLLSTIQLDALDESPDIYYRLLRAIIYQQLSGKAADTIFGRFVGLFPEEYPSIDLLLQYSIDQLRSVGLSRQKANYVQNVALHFQTHELNRQDWSELSNAQITQQLTAIKGVGEWTVQMILLFSLGRNDVFPTKDLAIQMSIKALYDLPETGRALIKKMDQIATQWQPYRSFASRYLWRWYDLQRENS